MAGQLIRHMTVEQDRSLFSALWGIQAYKKFWTVYWSHPIDENKIVAISIALN